VTRWRLLLEYDGTGLVGWQRQTNGRSVQQAVEEAVERFSGETVTVVAAGRTDAGVHALGQVAHFDLTRPSEPDTVRDAVNFYLKPEAIGVLEASVVDDAFHARFDAVERSYRYRILNRAAPATLTRDRVWFVPVPLDAEAMRRAARVLVGRHDFTTFRSAECQSKSPLKTLDELDVVRSGEEIVIEARAPSFLHNQVRRMVGSLKLIGDGKWHAADLAAALAARDGTRSGPTAQAAGLYLVSVRY